MEKFIITINDRPYCGDDCEPGDDCAIIYDNMCHAQTDLTLILKNWVLDINDVLKIELVKMPNSPNLPILQIKAK